MRRGLAIAVAVAALAVAGGVARAEGFALERYEPTPAGEWSFMVDHPWYSSTRWFAGVSAGVADEPSSK